MTTFLCTFNRWLTAALVLLALAGCGQGVEPSATSEPAGAVASLAGTARAKVAPAEEGAIQRHLALKYVLTVEGDADTLEQGWKAVSARCQALQCDILEGNFAHGRDRSAPQGYLHVRIAPERLDDFLRATESSGALIASSMTREDKTAEVIDVDARMRNMTELRDRLRSMLQSRGGALKDVLEVERELAQVQSQIDSLTGLRKALAAETSKIEVTIRFVARGSFVDASKTSPLRKAWSNMLGVFLASVGSLILFLAAVAPWSIIVMPLLWWMRRALRRRRERKAASNG
ncbi:MAG: DUF4349 domain-containing protein [Rhodocyclaceae bacterium]